jgi:hypothetical protein
VSDVSDGAGGPLSSIFRNWHLKLAALGLAAALWIFVMTSEKADMVVSAPVELESTPAGLNIVGDRPESVDVQRHGLRTTLVRVPLDQVRVRVSLAGARPGETVIRVLPEQVAVPPGVAVTRITPSRIRILLEGSR